eukprot:718299-Rhodomonas_salina.1
MGTRETAVLYCQSENCKTLQPAYPGTRGTHQEEDHSTQTLFCFSADEREASDERATGASPPTNNCVIACRQCVCPARFPSLFACVQRCFVQRLCMCFTATFSWPTASRGAKIWRLWCAGGVRSLVQVLVVKP